MKMLNIDVKLILCVVINMHMLTRGSEYRTSAKELTRRMEIAGMSCFRVGGSDMTDLDLVNLKPGNNKCQCNQPLRTIKRMGRTFENEFRRYCINVDRRVEHVIGVG
jgi:hypothetical protein